MQSLRPTLFRPLTHTYTRTFSCSPRAALARMQLIGRLAADPELTATSGGREIVRYAVATSSGPKDNRQTSFFRVTSFEEGARRDVLLGCAKGTLLFVEAESKMRSYEDKEGAKRLTLDLVQRNFDILSRPRNASEAAEVAAEEPMAASA